MAAPAFSNPAGSGSDSQLLSKEPGSGSAQKGKRNKGRIDDRLYRKRTDKGKREIRKWERRTEGERERGGGEAER